MALSIAWGAALLVLAALKVADDRVLARQPLLDHLATDHGLGVVQTVHDDGLGFGLADLGQHEPELHVAVLGSVPINRVHLIVGV